MRFFLVHRFFCFLFGGLIFSVILKSIGYLVTTVVSTGKNIPSVFMFFNENNLVVINKITTFAVEKENDN